jgi:excisionase family DNA binding protein
MNPLPLLTVKEAGDILRLNIFSVYAMARDGRLPTLRLGRRIRFRPEELEAWLAAGGTGAQVRESSKRPERSAVAIRGKRER